MAPLYDTCPLVVMVYVGKGFGNQQFSLQIIRNLQVFYYQNFFMEFVEVIQMTPS